MALRYTAAFEGYNPYTSQFNQYEIEIDDVNYVGDPSELLFGGHPMECEYQNTSREAFPATVPSYLNLNLLATESFQLQQMYTDNERALKVVIKIDGNIWGYYFVIPDGTSESFIDPPYDVSVRCIDGLGLLKNFDYIDTIGNASILQVIARCLDNLGLDLNINTFSTISYQGMVSESDPYLQTIIHQERFEGMKCDEVFNQLMKEWVSGIMQINGEWYLFRYPDLIANEGSVTFKKYDSELNLIGSELVSTDLVLGTNEGDIIHCNRDQFRSVNMPYKSVSILYKYGFLKNLLNKEASILLGSSSLNFEGWNKLGGIDALPNWPLVNRDYAIINGRLTGASESKYLELKTPIPVAGAKNMRIEITFNVQAANAATYDIILTDGDVVLKLNGKGEWVEGQNVILTMDNYVRESDGDTLGLGDTVRGEKEFELPPDSEDWTIIVRLYPSYFQSSNIFTGHPGIAKIYEVKLFATSSERGILSETRKITNNGIYTQVPEVIEVATGESQYKVYLGTMFKADGVTPTDGFKRHNDVSYVPFLELAAKDILFQHGKPMNRYEGSIIGIFSFLSKISINGLSGVFMPVSLNYDFKNSVTRAVLSEVNATPVPHEVEPVVYEYAETKEAKVKQE